MARYELHLPFLDYTTQTFFHTEHCNAFGLDILARQTPQSGHGYSASRRAAKLSGAEPRSGSYFLTRAALT